jgi:hypothetical protein
MGKVVRLLIYNAEYIKHKCGSVTEAVPFQSACSEFQSAMVALEVPSKVRSYFIHAAVLLNMLVVKPAVTVLTRILPKRN